MASVPTIPSPRQAVTNAYDSQLQITTADATRETDYDFTFRPNLKPSQRKGTHFDPLIVNYRESIYQKLEPTPLGLFQAFTPLSLLEKWVKYTNEGPEPGPAGPPSRRSRKLRWTPTSSAEIYLFLAILIYVGNHKESEISSFWRIPHADSYVPEHPIAKVMTYDRFQRLYRRIRISQPSSSASSFSRCDEWSKLIQRVSLEKCQPGTNISVDECMVRFEGRSKETTKVPSKPIPEGFKIWVLAQEGFFMGLIWHDPKQPFGPAAVDPSSQAKVIAQGKRRNKDLLSLNPTQSVVIALINVVLPGTYHVFFDNLFSSPQLLLALRYRGIAATGTARRNCGFFEPFAELKSLDKKGQLDWLWNRLESAATEDNMVSQINQTLPLMNQLLIRLSNP
jgi:hypothetical protein